MAFRQPAERIGRRRGRDAATRAEPSPKVTKAAKSYEELVEASKAEVRFGKSYSTRWRSACLSLWDIRQHGNVRCRPDITYAQAAKPEADEGVVTARPGRSQASSCRAMTSR